MKYIYFSSKYFLLLFFLLSAITYAQDAKQLFDNELKFCKTLSEIGYSKAFVQFIADDGIMFVPTPQSGKEYYTKNQNESKGLIWEAEFAEISLNGDFGYTTGPWHITRNSKTGESVTYYGHFNTVWQKINGEWKFLIDCGVSYDKELMEKSSATRFTPKPVPAPQLKRERFAFEAVLEIDNNFNNIVADEGYKTAYEKYSSENIRVYRDKKYPVSGVQNAKEFFTADKIFLTHMGGKSSPAGDLAFTYGVAGKDTESPDFNYMKVWKKEGPDWKIVLDVMTSIK